MTVKQELERIRKAHGGILRPADVVKFAENPKTALHKRFEWNRDVAAHEYRMEQARRIIRFTIRVIQHHNRPIRVRAYHSLPSERGKGDSYRDIVTVMSRKEMRAELLKTALQEAKDWAERYARLKEVAPIIAAIRKVTKPKGKKRR